jgi:hypothetical protein
MDVAVTPGDMLQALSQLRVTGGRLGERQLCGRRLRVVVQEGSVLPVA